MSTADNSDRRVTLEDPGERWAIREGYLTEQTVWWNESGSTKTTQHLTRGELQAIVNQAASRYGIRPECDCYPAGITPDNFEGPKEDCPVHGRMAVGCQCPPCPGKGIDGNGLNHCAECCWGTRVVADIDCPTHGREATR